MAIAGLSEPASTMPGPSHPTVPPSPTASWFAVKESLPVWATFSFGPVNSAAGDGGLLVQLLEFFTPRNRIVSPDVGTVCRSQPASSDVVLQVLAPISTSECEPLTWMVTAPA